MNDLISRDKLRKEILDKFPQGSARGVFLAFVDEQPTVEPVRGEWKVKTKSNNGYTVSITCSVCGYSHSRVMYNFCPECGADMRKGGVNNV